SVQSLFGGISWMLGDATVQRYVLNGAKLNPMQWYYLTMAPLFASCACFAVFVKLFVTDVQEEEEWVEYVEDDQE
ncbi:hypothetical protein HDU98_004033, partial [Podochytrium sp. JEL0797]